MNHAMQDAEQLLHKGDESKRMAGLNQMIALASDGDSEAQFYLAEIYRNGDCRVDFNLDESIKWHLESAKNGVVKSQEILGDIYDGSYRFEDIDDDKSIYWWCKAFLNGSECAKKKLLKISDRYDEKMCQRIVGKFEIDEDDSN